MVVVPEKATKCLQLKEEAKFPYYLWAQDVWRGCLEMEATNVKHKEDKSMVAEQACCCNDGDIMWLFGDAGDFSQVGIKNRVYF